MGGNTVALDATNASKREQGLLLWPLKAIMLGLVGRLGTVVAGKILPIDLLPILADGPLSTDQVWLAVSSLTAIALALVAVLARVCSCGLSEFLDGLIARVVLLSGAKPRSSNPIA